MRINNNPTYNKYNQTFGAKLGWRAVYELKRNPVKLAEVTQKLEKMGEPTTVVDIMSQNTRKGSLYSLRLFNEIFGEGYSVPMLKDNYNKEIISSSAKDFLSTIENLTKPVLENKEYNLFNKIKNEHSGSGVMMKYLKDLLSRSKEDGKYLSPKSVQILLK